MEVLLSLDNVLNNKMPLWEGKVIGVAIGVRLLEPRGRLGRDAGSLWGNGGIFSLLRS